jgi:hypothetical protein
VTHSIGQAGGTPVPIGYPEGFVEHAFQKTFFVGHPVGRVWAWLNDPATFVEGQVWPFRVEFVDGGFEPGVLNVHHGPFLNVAGAISPRLARPTRLQFWAEEGGGGTLVTLRLDALVRRPFVRAWDLGQRAFWSRFPRWMDSALRNPGGASA